MSSMRTAVFAVALSFLLGAPTDARACWVTGTLVCANDPSIVVTGETVSFTLLAGLEYDAALNPNGAAPIGSVKTATSDASGSLVGSDGNLLHLGYNTDWSVSLFGDLTCGDAAGSYQVWRDGLLYVDLGRLPVESAQCATTCTISLPAANPFCPSRPIGKPRSECELFGLAALDKNDGLSGTTWTATTDARLALVKAGGCYKYFVDVKVGDALGSPNGQGISHVTYCACK